MARVTRFRVVPRLPKAIARLNDIANNLWWCWNHEAIELFFRIDRDLWTFVQQNPRRLLGEVSQERLEELAKDDSFLAHLDRVTTALDEYMAGSRWMTKNPQTPEGFQVAYLSAEFGIQESLSIYSGGLGVLAGDHLKAASDLGMPLAGIGLLYREGYFQQYLNPDGWQQERYPRNDFYNMCIEPVLDESGAQLLIEVPYPKGPVKTKIWKCQVGRVPLYLLDCDHEANSPGDRAITDKLYGGDHETRVRQEIMLGMGGVLAMQALGVKPTAYHMNEGHAAFMALQRIKELVLNEGLSFDQAVETVKAGSHFTTHTPVPAGNDMFDAALIDRYFGKYCQEVGISIDRLLALGRQDPADADEPFCMTVLALKLAASANGVSKLHGAVARNMWNNTWAGVPEDETPIGSITNGTHTSSWISRDMGDLYSRYLGPGWTNSPDDPVVWARIDEVPDPELWRTHERRRERLVNFARRRVFGQLRESGATVVEQRAAMELLDPDVLTIGFARRFAMYKRANLILRDRKRLKAILSNPNRPVQLIIAGKAHPADNQAKELIRQLIHFTRDPEVRNRVVFIENYDMNVARYMVQGVDCWLNTPRRPMEASGTSGMKAAANGALNISIRDGWWCETGDTDDNGWSIDRGESYESTEEQDQIESEALYDILEQEVAPTFYQRGRDGVPRDWVRLMKGAIRTICPVFNTHRMVQEYADRFYQPCSTRRAELMANGRKRALALAEWKARVAGAWSQVMVTRVEAEDVDAVPVGGRLGVVAEVDLGSLTNEDVLVEAYYGDLDAHGAIPRGKVEEMACAEKVGERRYRYEAAIPCERTGEQGFSVRVIPNHPDLAQKHETAIITWG